MFFPSERKYTVLYCARNTKIGSAIGWFLDQYEKSLEPSGFSAKEYNWHSATLPHLGEVSHTTSCYISLYEMPDLCMQNIDLFEVTSMWLRKGLLYSGEIWNCEPDFLVSRLTYLDDSYFDLVFIHDNAHKAYPPGELEKLIVQTKLAQRGATPDWAKDFPERIFDIQSTWRAVSTIISDPDFPKDELTKHDPRELSAKQALDIVGKISMRAYFARQSKET